MPIRMARRDITSRKKKIFAKSRCEVLDMVLFQLLRRGA